jgi:hypothetical protein
MLTIATNYPWRCTPCLVSHRSSLAIPQHHRARPLPCNPPARTHVDWLAAPHVLNAVDNLPYQTRGKYTTSDFTGRFNDWRVAIAWVACRSPTLPSPATAPLPGPSAPHFFPYPPEAAALQEQLVGQQAPDTGTAA